MRLLSTLLMLLAGGAMLSASGADANELRREGLDALRMADTDATAVVAALRKFVAAVTIYVQENDDQKSVEMNSYIYWCRKKMTLAQIEEFARDPAGAREAARLDQVAKPVPASEAATYFQRAENFAADHPTEYMAIAIRYFEVADRFAGTPTSLEAQRKSLEAQQSVLKEARPAGTPVKRAAPPEPINTAGLTPTPDSAKLKEAEKNVHEIFKQDFAKVRPEDKIALAKKLMSQAATSLGDAASAFVLWREASTVAAQAGDVETTLAALDGLSNAFADAAPVKRSTLSALSGVVRDAEASRMIVAMKSLVDKPDDPAAWLVLGKYYCFIKRNWKVGMPYLAKGSDPALKKAAELEAAGGSGADAGIAAGDAWSELAEKENSGSRKAVLVDRARYWYKLVLPGATGLNQSKLEKRIQELETSVPFVLGGLRVGSKRTELAGGKGGGAWEDCPEKYALLRGARVQVNTSSTTTNIIHSVQPLFLSSTGNSEGKRHGTGEEKAVDLVAKAGFAVGGIVVRSADRVDAFKFIYMRITAKGLDPNDKYEGSWIGGRGGREQTLGGTGAPVIGMFGKSGNDLDAIGLVLTP